MVTNKSTRVAPYLEGTSSRTADKFVMRLPEGMRNALAELTTTTGRSMNSELVLALKQHLQNPETGHVKAWSPRIGDLVEDNDDQQVGTIIDFAIVNKDLVASVRVIGLSTPQVIKLSKLSPVELLV